MSAITTEQEWLENQNTAIRELKEQKTVLACLPCVLKCEINNSCNYRCLHCPNVRSHNSDKLRFEEIDLLISYAKYAYLVCTSNVAEPFTTIPEYEYLVSGMRKINPYAKIQTITNGLLLDKAIPIIRNNVNDVVLSLNTLSEQDYVKLMGSGSLSKVINNIDLFKNTITNATLRINCLLSLYCDPLKMINFAVEHGIDGVTFIKLNISNSNIFMKEMEIKNIDQTVLDISEYSKISGIKTSFWYWGKENIPETVANFFDVPKEIRRFSYFLRDQTCPSNAPWLQLTTAMREVSHCTCSNFRIGSIGGNIYDVWNNTYFQNLRKRILSHSYPAACNCKYVEKKLSSNQIEIKEGDTLYKLFGDDWKSIYELGANEQFREENPDPNIIIPGSVINFK